MRFSIQSIQVDISSVKVLVLLASLYFVIFSDCQYHIGLHGNLRTGFRGARILQFRACPLASLAKFFSWLAWRLFAGYLHGHRRHCPRMCHPEEQLHGPSRSTKTDYIFYSPNNYHRYNSLSDWSTSPTITGEQIIDRVDSFLLWAYDGVRCYSYEPNILCDNTLFKKTTKVTFGPITVPSTIWTLLLTVV